MNLLIKLYLIFFQIGALAFGGGYAVLPLIQRYIVEEEGWLTMMEMTDVVSISQMTPGPIAINSATFVGTKIAGLPGALIATLGSVTPQFIIMMGLSYFIFRDKKILFLEKILKGLRPGIVGLIAIAAISMFTSSIWPEGHFSLLATITFIIGFGLKWFKNMDLITLILIGAGVGLLSNLIL